jgi:oligopeptidase B
LGDPKQAEFFRYMLSYSPYENIKQQKYPHLYLTTSVNDQRVGYWEPAKFVAKLREYKKDHNKIIFKIKMNAGHIDNHCSLEHLNEIADEYIFIYQVFDMLK